jgi:hypothetical protein
MARAEPAPGVEVEDLLNDADLVVDGHKGVIGRFHRKAVRRRPDSGRSVGD